MRTQIATAPGRSSPNSGGPCQPIPNLSSPFPNLSWPETDSMIENVAFKYQIKSGVKVTSTATPAVTGFKLPRSEQRRLSALAVLVLLRLLCVQEKLERLDSHHDFHVTSRPGHARTSPAPRQQVRWWHDSESSSLYPKIGPPSRSGLQVRVYRDIYPPAAGGATQGSRWSPGPAARRPQVTRRASDQGRDSPTGAITLMVTGQNRRRGPAQASAQPAVALSETRSSLGFPSPDPASRLSRRDWEPGPRQCPAPGPRAWPHRQVTVTQHGLSRSIHSTASESGHH